MARFTIQELDEAIQAVDFGIHPPFDKKRHPYEQILIAYEWLDAQPKIKGPQDRSFNLKNIIAEWGKCYLVEGAVIVAAHLHPQISGTYPYYNLGLRLILPKVERISDIPEAFTHCFSKKNYSYVYGNRKE